MAKKKAEDKAEELKTAEATEEHVDISEEEAEAAMLAMLEGDQSLEQNDETSINASVADFPQFDSSTKKGIWGDDKLEFLKDLQLNVYIELGRTKMQIKDILELERGYVIELEKLASEPVDVFVNNKKIAEGEVVVIDKHFGIRITNLLETSERISGIK